jgi:PAS domain S-box-containing protein
VSARHQAEIELRLLNEELARERARLEAVVEQIPVGLVMLEAETGRVELANAEALRILALPPESQNAIGDLAAWESFRADGTRYEVRELPIRRALAGEVVEAERLEVLRGDGRRALLEVSSAPIRDPRGSTVGAVAVFHDVTERERLERAEREFVTNAAHELRTPLAAISSAIEVLQSGAKEAPEDRDRFLAHIDREVRRLGRLTISLLSLARAQGGAERPRLELVQLCPLLQALAAEARAAEAVAVEADCPPDLVAVANGDLLEHALTNLVANAVHNTSEGSILLAARAVDEQKVVIEVRDTGRGIPAAERARVTERFYRGSDGEGFGLGLAIAAQAVRAVGAELQLESEAGRGTTARVTLSSARLVTA